MRDRNVEKKSNIDVSSQSESQRLRVRRSRVLKIVNRRRPDVAESGEQAGVAVAAGGEAIGAENGPRNVRDVDYYMHVTVDQRRSRLVSFVVR